MVKQFKVVKDPFYDFLVIDASVGAYSFAMVPATGKYEFSNRADAEKRAKEISGTEIETMMIETPERFEAVADTKYGAAW